LNLTPDLDLSTCFYLIKRGTIRLEINFSQALDTPVNVIVYSEFDSGIKIDRTYEFLRVMNSKEIYSILENDEWVKKMNFLGVFLIDRVPSSSLTDYPCCGIVNTKPHNHPGEHWVMFLKTEYNIGVYFDSFGSGLYNMPEVAAIFDSVNSWQFNGTQLQSDIICLVMIITVLYYIIFHFIQ